MVQLCDTHVPTHTHACTHVAFYYTRTHIHSVYHNGTLYYNFILNESNVRL